MKKILMPAALVALLAMGGVSYAVNAALEQEGTLSSSVLPANGVVLPTAAQSLTPGANVATNGDELGEARYKERDLEAGNTVNRRELRVRGDELTVSTITGLPIVVTSATRADAADGDLYKVAINGAFVRNAANTADATVPAEAGRAELRGKSEQDRPDANITVPNLDASANGALVQWVDKNGFVAQSGVIQED
jgi:hypothetical protein